jgi:hypothetical protein
LEQTDTVTETDIRSEALEDEQLALLLEVSVGGAYYIRPGFALRSSYSMMYITNIATAFENLSLAATFPPLDVSGDGFYHGLSSGFELTW